MISPEISLLGLALAIDAAVVSFAMGLLMVQLTPSEKLLRGSIITTTFALFQFLMLWAGSYFGFLLTFSSYGHLSQNIVALIFLVLAVKFYQEGNKLEKREFQGGFLPLIILAIATSIDALAAGVSFATYPKPHYAAMEVGGITFILCGTFFGMSQFLYKIPEKWLLYLAALIFTFLSMRIILPQFL